MAAVLIFLLAGGYLQAGSSAETNAWRSAIKLFQDAKGPTVLGMSENEFANFIKKYPTSEHFSEAVVFEARALFDQEKFDDVIALLAGQSANAGKLSDQFAYWTAKAYAKKKNYEQAADTFARLVRENPDSNLKLEAIYREAEAHAKLEYWPRVIEELREPDGVFQRMAKTNRTDDLVVGGLLLLSEAELAQKEYGAAEKTLSEIPAGKSEWERLSLLCRVQLESGHAEAALTTSTNLLAAAGGKPELKGKSIFLNAEALERLEQFPAAIQAYEANANGDLPQEWRRQALLKIVELMLREGETEKAAVRLDVFVSKQPDEKGRDFERLMLGELRLKLSYQASDGKTPVSGSTNLLLAADDFQKLIKDFPNSPYVGKAWLNLGWCLAAENKTNESEIAFSNALQHLSFSEEQALARFKLADILFQRADFAGATSNYQAIIDQYGSLSHVKNDLFEQALYQILRSSLAGTNLTPANLSAATNAMSRILEWFPDGALAERSMLLVGQEQTPAEARVIFTGFQAHFTNSPLLPEVKLALARTYEREANWPEAIAQYGAWVAEHPDNPSLPRAAFSQAWANYKAGNETNAFMLFTNFVARFGSNQIALSLDLPARAQYWVGDYYWRQEDLQKAEICYEEIYFKWKESPTAFEAMMQAGRAALKIPNPQAAIMCFTNVSLNPNCPPGLMARAQYANGDATFDLGSPTNLVPYQDASKIFAHIANTFTNNPIAALAWGRLGECYLQLAVNDPSQYTNTVNAFEHVIFIPSNLADAKTRSMAEIQLGQTFELMASLSSGAEKKSLLERALEHFTNVLDGNNLRENEPADLKSVKDAGFEAAKLAEGQGEWEQARQFYKRLKQKIPSLAPALDKKIEKLPENI